MRRTRQQVQRRQRWQRRLRPTCAALLALVLVLLLAVIHMSGPSFTAAAVTRGSPGATLAWFDGTQTQTDVSAAGSNLGVDFTAITAFGSGACYCTYTPPADDSSDQLVLAVGALTPEQATTIATTLVADGHANAIIRPMWEMNGNWFPWSSLTPAQFIATWQALVTAARAVPGAAFTFMWNVNGLNQDNGAWNDTYPGSAYVDAIGIDQYDFSGYAANIATVQTFAQAQGKPFDIPEWGLNGSDDPAYIDAIAAWTGVSEIGYFSWAGNIDSLLNSFPNSEAEFSADFGTTSVTPPGSTTEPATTTTTPSSTSSTTTTAAPSTTTTAPPVNPTATTCRLWVPPDPTSATGLATPYRLMGCDESNPNQSLFVQAAILDSSGAISIYSPLVVNDGTSPLTAPVVPTIPAGSTVGIWFGGDDVFTILTGPGARDCVNGTRGSPFGQFAYCHAVRFFTAANLAILAGHLTVPPLGTATNGSVCPSVRDFRIVDQDPSDNVQTKYLDLGDSFAQDTAANRALFPAAAIMFNPSDNGLLTGFVDPAIGCSPWERPNLADPGASVPALPLDELQAAAHQAPPLGLVPEGDEMVLNNRGQENAAKTNLYRVGVDQPPVGPLAYGDDATWCANLVTVAPAFFKANEAELTAAASPLSDVATNLFTFLTNRFVGTYGSLFDKPCAQTIGIGDPVRVVLNAQGVAAGASVR